MVTWDHRGSFSWTLGRIVFDSKPDTSPSASRCFSGAFVTVQSCFLSPRGKGELVESLHTSIFWKKITAGRKGSGSTRTLKMKQRKALQDCCFIRLEPVSAIPEIPGAGGRPRGGTCLRYHLVNWGSQDRWGAVYYLIYHPRLQSKLVLTSHSDNIRFNIICWRYEQHFFVQKKNDFQGMYYGKDYNKLNA